MLVSSILPRFLTCLLQGITFEKMDELYESGVSPRHFKKHTDAAQDAVVEGKLDSSVEKVEVSEQPGKGA